MISRFILLGFLAPALYAAPGMTAEAPKVLWDKTFGGAKAELARAVATLPNGGIIVAGETESKGAGWNDAWIIRLDSDGNRLWDKTFGTAKWDTAEAIATLPDGGVAIAGNTNSKGAGKSDIWVIRLDSDGNIVWDKTFGGGGSEFSRAIATLPGGGLIVAGSTDSKGAGKSDVWVIRLDANGDMLWDKTFGGAASDTASDITVLPDGGIAVAGNTKSKGAGEDDVWVIRLDADGDTLWDKTVGSANIDIANAIEPVTGGGFTVVGRTSAKAPGKFDALVVRLDAKGNRLWAKILGGAEWDTANAITTFSDGGSIVAGNTESKGAGGSDVWVIRLDSDGNILWDKTFGGASGDFSSAMTTFPGGGILLVGSTHSKGAGKSDIWVLRLEDVPGEAISEAGKAKVQPKSGIDVEPKPRKGCTVNEILREVAGCD
jgi:uncharacterized delta-60 repeat protein